METIGMDERIQELVLILRSHFLDFDAKKAFPAISENQWLELYDLSIAHGVQGFAYEGIYKSGLPLPEGLRQRWRKKMTDDVLKYYSLQKEFFRVMILLRQNGILPVVLKGFSVSQLYPIPELRVMGDMDILVREKFYEAALCLEQLGYKARKEVAIHHVEFSSGKYII